MSDPERGDGVPPVAAESAPAETSAETPDETSAETSAETPDETTAVAVAAGVRRPRHPFYLRGRHIRLPRSRAGLFALLLVLGAGGSVVAFTGVTMIQWTETADFCGRCHTMYPGLDMAFAAVHVAV